MKKCPIVKKKIEEDFQIIFLIVTAVIKVINNFTNLNDGKFYFG